MLKTYLSYQISLERNIAYHFCGALTSDRYYNVTKSLGTEASFTVCEIVLIYYQ